MRHTKWLAAVVLMLGVSAPAWSQTFLGLGSSTASPTATSASSSTPKTMTPTQTYNWSFKFQDFIPSLPKIFQRNTYPGTSAFPTPDNQPGAEYLKAVGVTKGKIVHLSD